MAAMIITLTNMVRLNIPRLTSAHPTGSEESTIKKIIAMMSWIISIHIDIFP
jgi:hypothetical protein